MDDVLATTLKANLKAAKSPEQHQSAMTLAMIALVDCQRKTADRVKKLAADSWKIRLGLYTIAAGGGVGAAKLWDILFK